MMARGFKPVGLVAGVAVAALSCYMLSLNVAAERAELAKLERRIIMAKRDIRTLQTELGTRGRLQQLESWNANVLALAAPTSAQFLENEMTLARFDQREKTMEERAAVQLAAADTTEAQAKPQPRAETRVQYAAAPAPQARSLVQRASLTMAEVKPAEAKKATVETTIAKKVSADAAPTKKKALIDDKLVKAIGEAAKQEKKSGGAAGQ